MTDEEKNTDEKIKAEEKQYSKQESSNHEKTHSSGAEESRQTQRASSATAINNSKEQSDQSGDTGKKKKRPKAMKKADIVSFEDFIAYVYKSKGRKVSLSGKLQKQISEDLTLSEEAKQRISELVEKDKMLTVPLQLLLTARDFNKNPRLRTAIFSFVRDVLLQHPLFLRSDIENAVRNHVDAPDPVEVLKKIANSSKLIVKDQEGQPMKDMEFDKLRYNAVKCMIVWLTERKGLSIPEIVDALYLSLWKKKAKSLKGDNVQLRALTETWDFASVGLACGYYKSQAVEDKKVADEAIRDANILKDKVIELEDEIDNTNEAVLVAEKEHKEEKESLINEIGNLRTKAENDGAYHRDDMEKLRTKVLRRLKPDAAMLEDGLQALRRSEPKVHVMIDIAERVTDALRKEIKNLEGED